MPGGDTLKEFLINLGFEVDDKKYKATMGKLKGFEATAGKVVTAIGKNTAKGATVAVTALASITASVAAYMDSVAKADIETEKFARRMWMTETNARSLQNSLKAMGESMDTIYDVAANPELRSRFLQLRADAAKLEGGSEIEQGLREIRDFTFEFERFKLLVSYGSRYIGYYLSQYLAGPMGQIKAKLKAVNDDGKSFIETWGKRIAGFLAGMIRLFAAGGQAIGDLIGWIGRLPGEIKLVMAILGGLALVALNPFTLVIGAIAAVLLLLDDFYTWQRGGKSLLGDTWKELSNLEFDSQAFDSVKQLGTELGETFETVGDKWTELNKTLKEQTGLSAVEWVLKGIDGFLAGIADALSAILDFINRLMKGDFAEYFEGVAKMLTPGANDYEMAQNQKALDFAEMDKYINADMYQQYLDTQKQKPVNQALKPQPIPQMRIPMVASPTASAINSTKKTEVNQDNSVTAENKFYITGTDAQSIAFATASEMEIMMRRFNSSWYGNPIMIPEIGEG